LRKGFTGSKPEKVCHWMFDLMGLRPDDELVDLFSGSGAVAKAWAAWCNDLHLDFTATSHLPT